MLRHASPYAGEEVHAVQALSFSLAFQEAGVGSDEGVARWLVTQAQLAARHNAMWVAMCRADENMANAMTSFRNLALPGRATTQASRVRRTSHKCSETPRLMRPQSESPSTVPWLAGGLRRLNSAERAEPLSPFSRRYCSSNVSLRNRTGGWLVRYNQLPLEENAEPASLTSFSSCYCVKQLWQLLCHARAGMRPVAIKELPIQFLAVS